MKKIYKLTAFIVLSTFSAWGLAESSYYSPSSSYDYNYNDQKPAGKSLADRLGRESAVKSPSYYNSKVREALKNKASASKKRYKQEMEIRKQESTQDPSMFVRNNQGRGAPTVQRYKPAETAPPAPPPTQVYSVGNFQSPPPADSGDSGYDDFDDSESDADSSSGGWGISY